MKKRIFAAFVAAAVMAASAVTSFAEYDPNKAVENEIATKTVAPAFYLNVNGADIEAPAPYETEDGIIMVPLRALAESLGFNVEWQAETGTIVLINGPVYITMSPFADGYTFSKMAPVMLGTAPKAENGVTFVPSEFISQVLDGAYRTNDDGSIKIVWGEQKDVALVSKVDMEANQITVTDIIKGEVVLNVSEETYIADEEGNPVKISDIKDGMTVRVTYGDMMTRSLPPQNVPNSVIVLAGSPAMTIPSDEPVAEVQTATINSIKAEEKSITVTDSVMGEVILVVSDETVIKGTDGAELKFEALKEGMKVEIEYGAAMTMSLPPINNPISITVAE